MKNSVNCIHKYGHNDDYSDIDDDDEWDYIENQMKIDYIGNIKDKLNHENCRNYNKKLEHDLYRNLLIEGNNNHIFTNNIQTFKQIIGKIHIIDQKFIQFYIH